MDDLISMAYEKIRNVKENWDYPEIISFCSVRKRNHLQTNRIDTSSGQDHKRPVDGG